MERPYHRSARYYDEYYLRELDYEKQCDALVKILGKHGAKKGSSLLDLACGTGTHCIYLAKRGYRAMGVDISRDMIDEARKKAGETDNPIFIQQDMRHLCIGSSFDAVLCMFGGFGYLTEDEDLDQLFSGIKNYLNEDGLFLFEFWNIGGLNDTPYRTWRKVEIEDGWIYHISESNYDFKSSILEMMIEFLITSGNRVKDDIVERHRMRIYSLYEMRRILKGHGFEMLDAYSYMKWVGEKPLHQPDRKDFRIFVVARYSPGARSSQVSKAFHTTPRKGIG